MVVVSGTGVPCCICPGLILSVSLQFTVLGVQVAQATLVLPPPSSTKPVVRNCVGWGEPVGWAALCDAAGQRAAAAWVWVVFPCKQGKVITVHREVVVTWGIVTTWVLASGPCTSFFALLCWASARTVSDLCLCPQMSRCSWT